MLDCRHTKVWICIQLCSTLLAWQTIAVIRLLGAGAIHSFVFSCCLFDPANDYHSKSSWCWRNTLIGVFGLAFRPSKRLPYTRDSKLQMHTQLDLTDDFHSTLHRYSVCEWIAYSIRAMPYYCICVVGYKYNQQNLFLLETHQ